MTTPEQRTSPVDHGCELPLVLVVDTDGVVVCTVCRRGWTLDPVGWMGVATWPS